MIDLFAENTLRQWVTFVGVLAGAMGLLWVIGRVAVRRFAEFARSTTTWVDNLVAHVFGKSKVGLLFFVALFLASLSLTLPASLAQVLQRAAELALVIQVGVWATSGIGFWVDRFRERQLEEDAAAVTTVGALAFLARGAIWLVVLLLILDNLGVEVTALITGLGIGGIAVALAVQNILGDLFGSLSIVLDKPFVIGDFLRVGEEVGSVEHIGLKTTRLRSLTGEQLVLSNSDLLGARIRNYGRLYERRGTFTLGVTYQTPRDKLKKIPSLVREAIEEEEHARFDRSHFASYGAYSLDFETVFWVTKPEYEVYMETKQAVLLGIHERFESEGIEFAYPTQLILTQAS